MSASMVTRRLRTFCGLLAGLRRHDLRAAANLIGTFPDHGRFARLLAFVRWALRLMWTEIPATETWASFARPVSRTPVWLRDPDPFENHPWARDPGARLPERVEVAVIGAGMAGSAAAYHWAANAKAGQMAVLERDGVASGSAGRNEGLVVMGRYYYYVHHTVLAHLDRTRPDLGASGRDSLAHEYAAAYVRAAYANAEMIAATIERERIDCGYVRKGWVQATGPEALGRLDESVRMARETGFTDWTRISQEESFEKSGMRTSGPSGFSIGAACWHPAKWCWGLVEIALRSPLVSLFTRTRVTRVEDRGAHYAVHTDRGVVLARHVINAIESHTPQLFPEFHGIIRPMQTQAVWGESDGGSMKPGIGISGARAFFGRHGRGVIFGSDATRVPDREAGRNQPSRFISRFVLTELQRCFSVARIRVSHEWSGTVSYTPDEYPIVGSMDGKRLYMVGGMAGSGSGVSFNGAHHVVKTILGLDGPDYYPERFFSARRFRNPAPAGEGR